MKVNFKTYNICKGCLQIFIFFPTFISIRPQQCIWNAIDGRHIFRYQKFHISSAFSFIVFILFFIF